MATGNTSQTNQVTKPKKIWRHPLIWTVIAFLWIGIIIPILGSLVSNAIVLPDAWKQTMTKFSSWLFGNPPLLLSSLVILLLCTVIVFLLTRDRTHQETPLPVPVPLHQPATQPDPVPSVQSVPQIPIDVREKYLRIMLQKTLSLNLEGIPTPYRLPNVLLEEVFIPLEFLPRRLDSDYEITKEEGQHYLELEQKGAVPEDLERVFIDREHRLLERLKEEQRINISELWQRLDQKHATAVIQGQPGMGKSTLLARLTLYLTRLNLGETDTLMAQLSDVPIPILLILKDYATEYKKAYDSAKSLSISEYLLQTTRNIDISELFVFLKKSLTEGRCLVLFDGLDEISDLTIRRLIRDEIEHFIAEYSAIPSGPAFNRFLITSRVAGYEVVVFQHYQHVTVAALTEKQIKDFLPRWCHASLPAPERVGQDEHKAMLQEADLTAQRVMNTVTTSAGARKLADNPLLLTLLVVLQQNRVELPRQRWKLYSAITTMMLENRNSDKFLPVVEEKQAIKRLGPIAYDIQAQNNNFASKHSVNEKLCKIITDEGSGASPAEIETEAKTFLLRIRERSGLFVIRTGDYYGFFHRTFQEYFAARYILDLVKRDPTTWIATFVENARRNDDLWREPFLLAIAYQSNENETLAQEIITALLDHPQQDTVEQQTHDLLLAAECLLEAKPLDRALETRIAEYLVQAYEQALRTRKYDICDSIESIVSRLLLNLSQEAFRPALLDVLYKNICVIQQPASQRATLTLLAMIAQSLREGPELIFTKLIPPLLSLAGFSGVGKNDFKSKRYNPDPAVVLASHFDIADLTLSTLSFMEKRGPAGASLLETRHYFKNMHPMQLRQLAHFSLQSGILITPTVVPLSGENYKQYTVAMKQWQILKKSYDVNLITEENIDTCVLIHEALLAYAEEVAYPTTMHIQHMLQASEKASANWRSIWQDYLLNQLNGGNYVSYQESALLWVILFPSKQEQKDLTSIITKHMNNDNNFLQSYALRLISSLAVYSQNLRDPHLLRISSFLQIHLTSLISQNIQNIQEYLTSRNFRDLSDPLKSQDLPDPLKSQILQMSQEERNFLMMQIQNLLQSFLYPHISYFSSNSRFLLDLQNLQILQTLRRSLFVQLITIKCIALLIDSKDTLNENECVDLLTILIGRLFHMIEANEMGKDIEQETRQIVQTALRFLGSTKKQEVIEAARDILRSLPARTANEITFVLQQVENATDQDMQAAYIRALHSTKPHDNTAWDVLAMEKSSQVPSVQEVIKHVLERRK